MVNGLAHVTDTAPSSLASFNDTRCINDCANSTDPLLFTCELKNVPFLKFLLPNGDQDSISVNSTTEQIHSLSPGFTAVSLNVSEIDKLTRNISLTLSIANASLLNGREIICTDTLKNEVMAGCPVCGKFCS